jgi:uncharacterized repeat protein (TIGR02543 family)
MKAKVYALFGLVIMLAFVACDLSLNGTKNAAGNGDLLLVYISAGQQVPGGRTVLPVAPSQEDIANYVLFGGLAGQDQLLLEDFGNSLDNAYIAVNAGTWNFSLEARNSIGQVLLVGQISDLGISGTSAYDLHFMLSPLPMSEDFGNGSVHVTVELPEGHIAVTVVTSFMGEPVSPALPITGDSPAAIVFHQDNVAAGQHRLWFSLRDANGEELIFVPELVRVAPNLNSSKIIVLELADFNAAPLAPGNINAEYLPGIGDAGRFNISWTVTSNNETHFVLEAKQDEEEFTLVKDDIAAVENQFAWEGAGRGSSYQFRLAAVNRFGSTLSATTSGFAVPALYTVQFHLYGDQYSMPAQVEDGSPVAAPVVANRIGYVFEHWCSDEDRTVVYNFDEPVTAGMTLYAKWQVNSYKIHFNLGEADNTEAMPAQDVSYDETVTLAKSLYSRSGYDFSGWAESSGGVKVFDDEAAYTHTLTEDKHLYPAWQIKQFDVSFAANGASGALPETIRQDFGTTVTVPGPGSLHLVDYVFAGWQAEIAGATATYQLNNTFSLPAHDVVMTAQWTYIFVFNPATQEITDYLGPGGSVVIPSVIDGVDVTSIGATAFVNKGLSSVVIPDTVTTIKGNTPSAYGAFGNNPGLAEVTFSSSLTSVGQNAFWNCNLSTVVLKAGVTYGAYVFRDNPISNLTIEDGVTSIPNYGFYQSSTGKASFTSLAIPGTVTTIGASAFHRSAALTSLTIAPGLQSIGAGAFKETGLTSLTLPEGLTSIGNFAFNMCALTEVSLPASLSQIGDSAFSTGNKITSLTILGAGTSIGASAFSSNNISSLTLPDNVTVASNAFVHNPVASIVIGNNANIHSDSSTMGSNSANTFRSLYYSKPAEARGGTYLFSSHPSSTVFNIWERMEDYTVVDGVITNVSYTSKTSVAIHGTILGQTVTGIAADVFAGKAVANLHLPASLTSIGAGAFFGSTTISRIIIGANVDISDAEKTMGLKSTEFRDAYYPSRPAGLYTWQTSVYTVPG